VAPSANDRALRFPDTDDGSDGVGEHLWDGDDDGSIHARFAAMNDEIANSTFAPLDAGDPELDGRCRAAFVSEFVEQLNLTDELRPQVSAAVRFFVATGWARVVFGDYDGSTASWDGSEEALLQLAASEAVTHAEWYKEDRSRYGDRRWG
jgi:hypothetical protein